MIDLTKPIRRKSNGSMARATKGYGNNYLIETVDGEYEGVTSHCFLDDHFENVPEKRAPKEYRVRYGEVHTPSPDCRAHGCERVIEWPEGAPLPEWPE